MKLHENWTWRDFTFDDWWDILLLYLFFSKNPKKYTSESIETNKQKYTITTSLFW